MKGVTITPLKVIEGEKGKVMHALKASEPGYVSFGEAYFSSVDHKQVKGWKKHKKMTLNLVVPVGEIKFVIFDDREQSSTNNQFFEINVSEKNYCRLTIQPGLWVGFQGQAGGLNLLLNIADIIHDPLESENKALEEIKYEWL